jgi:hypothetical protein
MPARKQTPIKEIPQGSLSPLVTQVLVEVAGIRSDAIRLALYDHYIEGVQKSVAADLHQVERGAFSRALRLIEKTLHDCLWVSRLYSED